LKTKPRVLLVNPPIYDFTVYDFWLKPYGLLRVFGQLRGEADRLKGLARQLNRTLLPAA
jgi:hypothetical protein